MKEFSKRSTTLVDSELHGFFRMVAEYRSMGGDVINLGVGEPDVGTSNVVKESGINAILDDLTKYTPSSGLLELKKSIVSKLEREYLEYDTGSVVVSTGAKPILAASLSAMINSSSKTRVVIPAPYYPPFYNLSRFFGGYPVLVNTENDNFQLTAQSIERSIQSILKDRYGRSYHGVLPGVLILNSPNNPTGAVYSDENMLEVAELVKKYDMWVVSDESYADFTDTGDIYKSFASLPGMKERTVVIRSFSKGCAMTGWRVGYAVGPYDMMRNISLYLDNAVGCAPSMSQVAAITALNDTSFPRELSYRYVVSKELLMWYLNSISIPFVKPDGAFYIFADFTDRMVGLGLSDATDLALVLLKETGVAVTPGIAFGEEYRNYLRISHSVGGVKMTEAVKRLSSFFK